MADQTGISQTIDSSNVNFPYFKFKINFLYQARGRVKPNIASLKNCIL